MVLRTINGFEALAGMSVLALFIIPMRTYGHDLSHLDPYYFALIVTALGFFAGYVVGVCLWTLFLKRQRQQYKDHSGDPAPTLNVITGEYKDEGWK